jgi:hypothetical protein
LSVIALSRGAAIESACAAGPDYRHDSTGQRAILSLPARNGSLAECVKLRQGGGGSGEDTGHQPEDAAAGKLNGAGKQVSPEQMEIARLRAELARVKMERDILEKATAYFAKVSA